MGYCCSAGYPERVEHGCRSHTTLDFKRAGSIETNRIITTMLCLQSQTSHKKLFLEPAGMVDVNAAPTSEPRALRSCPPPTRHPRPIGDLVSRHNPSTRSGQGEAAGRKRTKELEELVAELRRDVACLRSSVALSRQQAAGAQSKAAAAKRAKRTLLATVEGLRRELEV